MSTPRRGSLAAGAARAGGERARRRGTPLIAGSEQGREEDATQQPPTKAAAAKPAAAKPAARKGAAKPAAEKPATEKPTTSKPAAEKPVAEKPASRKPAAKQAGAKKTAPAKRAATTRAADKPGRPTLHVVPDLEPDEAPAVTALTRADSGRPRRLARDERIRAAGEAASREAGSATVVPGIEELVQAGVAAVRAAATASGLSPEEVEQAIARSLAFIRRRLTGDYAVDDFGFDRDFTLNAYLPMLRPIYRSWFRVEARGLENIPAEGGALVVANHSGTIALDSLMTMVAVHDEHPQHRFLRMLGADLVFSTPVVGDMARKAGATLAAGEDAERLLRAGELVGVWPEGFKGTGKPFSERYKLQRFGRGGFVSAALRSGVPIIPCSIVGAEETYPMLGNMKTLARLLGTPYVPVTPTFPWLGPLGMVPLPSKWIIEFGAPVDTASLGAGAADDPMLVFDLTDQVRETIQQTLYSLLMRRRSVFF
ncbi:1-acyl-sn-glycerol-3-phosphate acyltransferase [Actinomycetota bacterium]